MESNDHPVHRFCMVTFPLFLEIVDYESKWAGGQIRDEFPRTKGAWSHILDSLASPFKFLGGLVNVSVNVEPEFGMKKKNRTLTGCYRSIRDNQSDFSLVAHDYPTVDYDKVDPYQVLGELSLSILSGYHSNAEADVSFNDFILTSMNSFDSQTWFAVLVMVSAFFGLWMTKIALFPDKNHLSLRRRIAEALWDTLLLFISQESTDYYKFMDRLLSILMTLSFFLLTNIYFGLMSTDLVSVTKPAVINSYQDIMNRPNITPALPIMTSDHQEFEDAYEENDGSIQAKFWAKYKDKVEMADPRSAPGKLINLMQEAFNMKRVLIMNEIAISISRRTTCRFKLGNQIFPNIYTWVSKDLNARKHKKVFIMRNGMKQTPQLKLFRRKMRSLVETGLFHNLMDAVVKDGLKFSEQFSLPEVPYSQMERCLSDQVVYAGASVDTVVLQNYYLLLAVAVVMLPASIMVLLIELYCHRNVQVPI